MRLPRLAGLNTAPQKLAMAIAVAATTAPAAVMAQGGLVLEEIVVTATKKDEMVQDVPSTVNVMTADKLASLNIFNFKDMEAMTPGLTLANVDGRNSAISMRGISFNPDSRAKDAVVPYLNGVPVRANEAFQQMYDLSRVEILRGPQGTLQGETSPAGSIQLYTKKANLDVVEGELMQTFSDNSGVNTQFAASMPIIEGVLAARIAGLYDESETGITTDSSVGGRTGTQDTQSGRLSISWVPTDNLTTDLTYQYMENTADGHQPVEGVPTVPGKPILHHSDRKALNEGPRDIFNRAEFVSLEVNYEFADHLLTFLSGYQDTINNAAEDKDSGNLAPGIKAQNVFTDITKTSQELRITNTDAEMWEYTAGVFFGKSASNTNNENNFAPGLPGLSLVNAQILAENYGVFLDNKWYVSDLTTVGLGVRWSKNRANNISDLDLSQLAYLLPPGTPLNQSLIPEGENVQTGIAWTGGLKVTHQLTEEVMIYASYDRSYRPPGVTITPSPVDVNALGFKEETSNSFEIGFKSTIDNGRFQVNGSVFQQNFKDYISRASNVSYYNGASGPTGTHNSTVQGGITFGGDAVIQGAEIDFNGVLTENWTAYFAASYIDAKYDGAERPIQDFTTPTAPGELLYAQTDGRIGPEPNWSISASSEYSIPMGETEGFVRGLYKFTDNRVDDGAGTDIGGYGLFDLFVGVRDIDGAWEASIWSKNLFDKDARTAINTVQVGTGYTEVAVVPERTIGITGKYKFGVF